jgi:phenylacetate-CoA ligase
MAPNPNRDVVFPAVAAGADGAVLALLYQLEQTQWWTAERLRDAQLAQLRSLLRHACSHVPWYRERMDACGFDALADFGWEDFTRLPVLTRTELQQHGGALESRRQIPEHGAISRGSSSGSTGTPVHFLSTGVTYRMWKAITLRDHLWHRRDFAGKLAVIRGEAFEGTLANWGQATADVAGTGATPMLNIKRPMAHQIDWLLDQDPMYLLTYPTNLEAMLRHCRDRGIRPSGVREVRTVAESVSPHQRDLCVEVWGVPLTDMYSAREAGYIALQCPGGTHYHVQSENVVVEIVRDNGLHCLPGEEGRVLLTVLNNFALPLVRYDVGDIAVPGAPCACGRGLPVIERIAGRVRNLMTLPDGSRRWPSLVAAFYDAIDPFTQFQVVQTSLNTLELHVVARRPPSKEETDSIKRKLNDCLRTDFAIELMLHDAIPRGPGGKYEEFVSKIDPGAGSTRRRP